MSLKSFANLGTETVESLADVDPAEWDRLAGREGPGQPWLVAHAGGHPYQPPALPIHFGTKRLRARGRRRLPDLRTNE